MIKKYKLSILFYFLTTLFCLTSCSSHSKLPVSTLSITKKDGTLINLQAEVAKTQEERNFGFMERKIIPDGTGMIFIFEKDQILSFWMKNTPHALSIAYIDSKGKIRDIFDMTPYSLASIVSTVSVRYALEVPQGWYQKNNINIGDTLSLDFLESH